MNARCYFYATMFLGSLTVFCNCYDVIIIGAGASGIAAGMYLLNNGIDNFVILEAEDRIGGRINSVEFGDASVDLGAEWCLGDEKNKVYSIAKDSHLLRAVDDNYTFSFSSYNEEDDGFLEHLRSDLIDMRRHFSDVSFHIMSSTPNKTLSDAFSHHMFIQFKTFYNAVDIDWFKAHRHRFQELKSIALSHESFFSWNDTIANHHHRKCDGKLQHFNGEGFSKIFHIMMNESPYSKAKNILHTKIIFNSEIENIIWTGHNNTGITVRNSKGDIYNSDLVIFTPSLGVLKEKHASLFEPALPQSKINALDCLGFEGVIKVFLQWDTTWWGEAFPPTLLFWSGDMIRALKESRTKFLHENDSDPWILSLTQFLPSPNNPKVLVAWFTGNMSKEIEELSDDDLLDGILIVMDTFFGEKYYFEKPDLMLRSSWNSNPHFLGSHSFEKMKAGSFSGSCNEEMSKPLYRKGKPVVLFAGEATSKHHYSTVHGAIESGEREGERVISAMSDISEKSIICFLSNC